MYLEISNRSRFSTRAGGLVQLNLDLTRFYKAHPTLTPVTPLYLSQLRNTQPAYPFLKAKAAQVRHLCEFGLTLALFVASHPPFVGIEFETRVSPTTTFGTVYCFERLPHFTGPAAEVWRRG